MSDFMNVPSSSYSSSPSSPSSPSSQSSQLSPSSQSSSSSSSSSGILTIGGKSYSINIIPLAPQKKAAPIPPNVPLKPFTQSAKHPPTKERRKFLWNLQPDDFEDLGMKKSICKAIRCRKYREQKKAAIASTMRSTHQRNADLVILEELFDVVCAEKEALEKEIQRLRTDTN